MVNKIKNIPVLRFPGFEDEWAKQKIGSLTTRISSPVDVEDEKLYQQIGIRSHGKGIFYKDFVSGKSLGNKRVFWVKENVFVVNIVFAWEQAVAKTTVNELGMIASHRFPMYKPLENISYLDFILYLFLTKKGKYLLELASPGGAGRNKTLGQSEFEKLKIIVPSYSEQQKIASFLTSVDERIQQLIRRKKLLEQYKKGVMQKIFSREIRFKDDKGKDFPDWEEKTLGELGVTYNGLTGKSKENFGKGFPYITYKQIFDNSIIDVSKFDFVEIDGNEKQNKAIYGDVFFTTSSETPNEVGFSSVLLEKVENLYLNSFCFGYRINSFELLSPKFAHFLFRNRIFRNKVEKLAQGSTRFNMSKIGLMQIAIELPSLPEQEKVFSFLTGIDKKIDLVNTQLQKTQAWKKGLLQKMFV